MDLLPPDYFGDIAQFLDGYDRIRLWFTGSRRIQWLLEKQRKLQLSWDFPTEVPWPSAVLAKFKSLRELHAVATSGALRPPSYGIYLNVLSKKLTKLELDLPDLVLHAQRPLAKTFPVLEYFFVRVKYPLDVPKFHPLPNTLLECHISIEDPCTDRLTPIFPTLPPALQAYSFSGIHTMPKTPIAPLASLKQLKVRVQAPDPKTLLGSFVFSPSLEALDLDLYYSRPSFNDWQAYIWTPAFSSMSNLRSLRLQIYNHIQGGADPFPDPAPLPCSLERLSIIARTHWVDDLQFAGYIRVLPHLKSIELNGTRPSLQLDQIFDSLYEAQKTLLIPNCSGPTTSHLPSGPKLEEVVFTGDFDYAKINRLPPSVTNLTLSFSSTGVTSQSLSPFTRFPPLLKCLSMESYEGVHDAPFDLATILPRELESLDARRWAPEIGAKCPESVKQLTINMHTDFSFFPASLTSLTLSDMGFLAHDKRRLPWKNLESALAMPRTLTELKLANVAECKEVSDWISLLGSPSHKGEISSLPYLETFTMDLLNLFDNHGAPPYESPRFNFPRLRTLRLPAPPFSSDWIASLPRSLRHLTLIKCRYNFGDKFSKEHVPLLPPFLFTLQLPTNLLMRDFKSLVGCSVTPVPPM